MPLRTLAVAALALTVPTTALAQAGPVGAREADRARIRAHFDAVEAELRAADTSGLTSAQRARRAEAIARLHRYAAAGVFPANTAFPGTRHPTFIDEAGRACAVAHLMLEDGARELAVTVQREHQRDYIAEMRTEGIGAWAASSGLTIAELAAIQPGYCECPATHDPVCGNNGLTYWNRCILENCASQGVAHEGECDRSDLVCALPVVESCSEGVSYGQCGDLSGDGEVHDEYEVRAMAEAPACESDAGVDAPASESDAGVDAPGASKGCAAAPSPTLLGLMIWLFALLYRRREPSVG